MTAGGGSAYDTPTMKTSTASIVWVGALLFAGAGWASATEPGGASPPGKARVLLLENDRVLQGDVDKVGEEYRLRRLTGETWVPANTVARVCASLDEAYQYLRGRANLRDPDERLRLANWCRLNELTPQALVEAEAALALRPEHAATRRLAGHLRDAVRKANGPERPASARANPPVPHVDLSTAALGQFSTRVQPILMNACACCHSPAHGGKFQLTRAKDVGLANKRTLNQNLTAVLAQVNAHEPSSSPLLTKAISIHAGGMSNAPLRNRQAVAFRALEEWVRLTIDHNPQLRERPPVPLDAPTLGATRWGEDAAPAPVQASVARPTPPRPAQPAPARAPAEAPDDPVGPSPFNHQFHPGRAPSPPAAPPRS